MTEYKYTYENGTLSIEFEGSTDREDWRENFRFWIKPYKDMPVKWYAHSGFVGKYKEVRDEILQLAEGAERIALSGHSQGGAVALLAHEDVKWHYPGKFVKTVTTGAPRVVWCWNYRKVRVRFGGVVRWVCAKDFVTKLPPWIFGYRHVGKKIVVKSPYFIWQFEKNHLIY